MAMSTSHVCLVFLTLSMYIYLSASIFNTQNTYPSESLACKTYELTKIDCSNRNLLEVPLLDQKSTTTLDLGHNGLVNITNAPFRKLQALLILVLSYNENSEMASTAFRGLQSLKHLDIQVNKLVDLPSGIFADLPDLIYLNMDTNYFTAIPGHALASLTSLQQLHFMNSEIISKLDFEGFQNLKNLSKLTLFIHSLGNLVRSDTFHQFHQLPLSSLSFSWLWQKAEPIHWPNKDVFSPLKSVTYMHTMYEALHALIELNSPLQTLGFVPSVSYPVVINRTSLQVLQKWNASLEILIIRLGSLKTVEDDTFIRIPNLLVLSLAFNQINRLAKDAFFGLNNLLWLDLSHNAMTEIPSDAFDAFRNSASFEDLDLRSNKIKITEDIAKTAFSVVASSLTDISMEVSNIPTREIAIDWLRLLRNLKHATLIFSESNLASVNSVQLPSLKTFTISNFQYMLFARPICVFFPTLEAVAMHTTTDETPQSFPLLYVLKTLLGCFHLKELDISGTVYDIKTSDLQHLNITISTLETMKLAQNKIPSTNFLSFINAPKLEHLDLATNLLTSVDIKIAHIYPNLVSLDIKDNELESLSGLEHLVFLQNLNAAGNKITVIPTWLLSKAINLKLLDLRNNPFECTCDIQPFKTWILSDKKTLLEPGQYVCSTPGDHKGMSVTAIKLDCKPKTAFYLSITIPLVLMFVVLSVIVIRYRWHIKYKLFLLYRNYRPFPDNDEDFEMLQLQYHAYVSHNEHSVVDDAWVMNDLQPNIEEGPDPIKLCIKSRDFIPGHFLLDSIDESIHRSRKTILVLSPNFVASEWCYHEMRMAQMRLLDDHLDVLVLVLLNDIPENKITLSLRQILCRKDYLKWPKDRAGQRLFWQRLREEIKSPVQVDRCFHF